MVDNVVINTGIASTIATDDVSGGIGQPIQIQRVKLDAGVEGVSSPVNINNALPVEIASDVGLALLRRLVKAVDSLQTVDSQQRQRITVDAGTLPVVTSVGTVTTLTSITNPIPVGNLATVAGVDPRYQFVDQARAAYNSGIRANLVF